MNLSTHPHSALLSEWQIAINNFVPTIPEELRQKAQKRLEELANNPQASEKDIRLGLIEVGREEYPHRHAFYDLTNPRQEKVLEERILTKVPPAMNSLLVDFIKTGEEIIDFARSKVFEDNFSPVERIGFERAFLDAKAEAIQILASSISVSSEEYQAAWKIWEDKAQQIERLLEEIDALKTVDPKWTSEIEGKVWRFREGFSITEPDPQIEDLRQELENWKGTLGLEV